MKKHIADVVLGISVVGFLMFSCSYIKERQEIKDTTIAIEQVQTKIEHLLNESVSESAESNGVVHILPRYRALYEANNDMVGFIYLDDTHRFPILQRVADQNYYIDKDFFEDECSAGSIFANNQCVLGSSGITLLYGHHIKGNQMFSALDKYKNKSVCDSAGQVKVDTLYEEANYKLHAVALCNMNDTFKYYEYVGALSEGDFELWKYLMDEYLIWGGLDSLPFGSTIIELSTCSYEKKDNRLIVILSKVDVIEK